MRRASSLRISGHLASFAADAFRKLSRGWRGGGGDALEFTWRRCTAPPPASTVPPPRRRFSGSRASHPRAFLRFFAPNPKIPRILSSLRRKFPFCDPKNQKRDPREYLFLFYPNPPVKWKKYRRTNNDRNTINNFSLSRLTVLSFSTLQDRNCSWTRIKSISSESRWRPSTGNRESRTVARTGTERDARLSAARSRQRHPFSAPSRSLPRHFSPARKTLT